MDFGGLLSSKNITTHLQDQWQGLKQYLKHYPEQVAERKALVADSRSNRVTLYGGYPELTPHHRF